MENQHRKISGYRELSQTEIDLMNEVKKHAEDTKILIDKLGEMRNQCGLTELGDIRLTESYRCLGLATNNLQTGFMWLVRGIALPTSF